MAAIAAIVFIALYFVEAGYGMLFDKKWGLPIPNKIAWICMEAPVFIVMFLLWNGSERQFETVPFLIFLFFELHYFQRSFIFPLLIKGKSKMPAGIMLMGITFNLLNGYMQGEWIFYLAPQDMYTKSWLHSPQFIVGTILFFTGMAINIQSDHIVRHLRKPGDTNHYLPKKGLFKYAYAADAKVVHSHNYGCLAQLHRNFDLGVSQEMLEFKGGSFKAATKAKCPIVPVALIDSFKPFDTNSIAPVTVQVHFLKPLYYDDYKDMKTNDIAELVRSQIQKTIHDSI